MKERVVVIYELFLTTLILFVAVLIDVWKHKIPNSLLALLILNNLLSSIFHFFSNCITFSFRDALVRCLTVILIFFFLYLLFSIGTIGAGDVKLIIVTLIGVEKPIKMLCAIFAIGALMSVIQMVRHKNLFYRLNFLKNYVNLTFVNRKISPYSGKEKVFNSYVCSGLSVLYADRSVFSITARGCDIGKICYL